jgi:hypothetical protein
MIRLVAIDLDGTLLNHQREIPAGNVAAVNAAKAAGVRVVLASGRIRPSMEPYAATLGLDGPMICANGAHVVGEEGREILHVGLDAATTETVLRYAEADGVHLNIYTRSTLRFLADTPWGEVYRGRVSAVRPGMLRPEERVGLSPTKLMIVADAADVPRHRAALTPEIDESLARMVVSEPEYLEFLSTSASKGSALKVLAEAYGYRREEVAAMGDYLNDLEMVKWAGLSGAPANAAPEVAAAATVQVASNEDEGVAEFINRYVLGGLAAPPVPQ